MKVWISKVNLLSDFEEQVTVTQKSWKIVGKNRDTGSMKWNKFAFTFKTL